MKTTLERFVCPETLSLTTPSSDLRSHRFQLRRQDSQPKNANPTGAKPRPLPPAPTVPSTENHGAQSPGLAATAGTVGCGQPGQGLRLGAAATAGAVPPEQSLHEGLITSPRPPSPSQWQELCPLRALGRPAPCPRLPVFTPIPVQGCWGGAWGRGAWPRAQGLSPVGSWDSRRWKLAAESGVHRAPAPPTPTVGTSTPPSLGSPSRGSRCSRQMERKPAALPSGHPFPGLLEPGVRAPTDRRTDASHQLSSGSLRAAGGSGQAERLPKLGAGCWPVVRLVAVAAARTATSCLRAPSFGPVLSLRSTHAAS